MASLDCPIVNSVIDLGMESHDPCSLNYDQNDVSTTMLVVQSLTVSSSDLNLQRTKICSTSIILENAVDRHIIDMQESARFAMRQRDSRFSSSNRSSNSSFSFKFLQSDAEPQVNNDQNSDKELNADNVSDSRSIDLLSDRHVHRDSLTTPESRVFMAAPRKVLKPLPKIGGEGE